MAVVGTETEEVTGAVNPCSIDVKDMLVAAGLGLTIKETLFVGFEPATPDECVTVLDISGWPARGTMDHAETYRYDAVQIRVRGRQYTACANRIEEIIEALQEQSHSVWNDTRYELIKPVSSPTFIGWDTSGRCQFLATIELQRTDNVED